MLSNSTPSSDARMAVISAGAADDLQVSDLVLAARALDVTVGAQKSISGERENRMA